ncbi:hypothetical protein PAXINDRAFT_10614 [Paxillus involutus ATCC 200175]|nr:hypothetical protein PAXINDRAFT_10614 [Paxillus involutus ATCC 200175]
MFFYNDGTHIFRAGRFLFKVHASILADKSESFHDMFGANLEATTPQIDGGTEDTPILVPPSVSEDAFELFISVCYNKWRPDTANVSDDVIVQLLDLSRQYICRDAQNYAIQRLSERRTAIQPSRLLSISMEYNIVPLFTYSFERLVKARFDNLTADEYTMVGPAVWAAILKVKELVNLNHHIVACEPPPMIHVTACTKHERCAHDWKQLWWNEGLQSIHTGRAPEFEGTIVSLFHLLFTWNDKGQPSGFRIEIPVGGSRFCGQYGMYPIKLFYMSNMPIMLQPALTSNMFLDSQTLASRFPSNFLVKLIGIWPPIHVHGQLSASRYL